MTAFHGQPSAATPMSGERLVPLQGVAASAWNESDCERPRATGAGTRRPLRLPVVEGEPNKGAKGLERA
jgi:hypothetical protein